MAILSKQMGNYVTDSREILPDSQELSSQERHRFNELVSAINDISDFFTTGDVGIPDFFVNVRRFGVSASKSSSYNSGAFADAIASLSEGPEWGASRLIVPRGVIRLSAPLVVSRQMILEGAAGGGDNNSSVLLFDAGVAGVQVTRGGGGVGAGDFSTIRSLAIRSAGGTTPVDGIEMRARARVVDCQIAGWYGDGVRVRSDGAGDNANGWKLIDSRIINCHGNAINVGGGGDTNAGYALGVDIESCGGWGIYENSFLGNTYLAMQIANCAAGAYKVVQVTSRTVLVGMYTESGQPPAEISYGAVAVGGPQGAGFANTAGTRIDAPNSNGGVGGLSIVNQPVGASVPDTFGALGTIDPGTAAFLTLWNGLTPGERLFLSALAPGDSGGQHAGSAWLTWNAGSLHGRRSRIAMSRASVGGTGGHRPRYVFPSTTLVVDPVWGLGDGDGEGTIGEGVQRVCSRTAAPTSGTWHEGDWVRNAGPSGPLGWRCTDGGTLGSYTEGCTATTHGTTTVNLSAYTYKFHIGDRLTINGVTTYVTDVDGVPCSVLTVADAIPSGSGLAITYTAPTFVTVYAVPPGTTPGDTLEWSGTAWTVVHK